MSDTTPVDDQVLRPGIFQRFIQRARCRRALVVQPRMGWGDPADMRAALLSVKASGPDTIGTLTLDSYTRTGNYRTPLVCLRKRQPLNGYPIVSHSVAVSQRLLAGVYGEEFPVRIRHGTPQPQSIFRRMIELGLDATEGGPVSYCLPYGRTPLELAIAAWEEGCRMLADRIEQPHLESFGGCLMGQLCPPSLLVAISLLECLFFKGCGISSVSLSYAQGTSYAQDLAALRLLRELAQQHLSDVDWHVVLYTYMGLFPRTEAGATRLIGDSARLARESESERLIVKTTAESRQLPSLADNLRALQIARVSGNTPYQVDLSAKLQRDCYDEIKSEVSSLLDAVLDLHADLGRAMLMAFRRGWLDIPHCLHADNPRQVLSAIDHQGLLVWADTGTLPLKTTDRRRCRPLRSADALLKQLSYVADRYDSLS